MCSLFLLQGNHLQKVIDLMSRLNPQLRTSLRPLHIEQKMARVLPDKLLLLKFNEQLHILSSKAFSDGILEFAQDAVASPTGRAIFGRPHAARIYDDMITSFLCSNYFPPIRLEVGCLVPCHVAMAGIRFGCDLTALLCAAQRGRSIALRGLCAHACICTVTRCHAPKQLHSSANWLTHLHDMPSAGAHEPHSPGARRCEALQRPRLPQRGLRRQPAGADG